MRSACSIDGRRKRRCSSCNRPVRKAGQMPAAVPARSSWRDRGHEALVQHMGLLELSRLGTRIPARGDDQAPGAHRVRRHRDRCGEPARLPDYLSKERRQEIKQVLDDQRDRAVQHAAGSRRRPGFNPASPSIEERRNTVEQYKKLIDLCAEWGGEDRSSTWRAGRSSASRATRHGSGAGRSCGRSLRSPRIAA